MRNYFSDSVGYKRKVAIIGVGYVGATISYSLMLKDVAREIVLIDTNDDKARGEAQDIKHGIPYLGSPRIYNGDYSDCKDCDLIVVTAGRNRRTGETRLEMAEDNVKIVRRVIIQLMEHYTRGVILLVTNPVDVITYNVTKWTELPRGLVFGTGCMLDSSRFVAVIAEHLGLKTEVINGLIVGEHGESQVPIWTNAMVAGVPIHDYCKALEIEFTQDIKDILCDKVKKMGSQIIKDKEKTHYGIATCVCYLADAILNNRATICSVSSVLENEYDVSDVSISVPSIVGACGVERRIEEKWGDYELKKFQESACKLKDAQSKISVG